MIALLSITLLVAGVHGNADSGHLCDELQRLDCSKDYVPTEQEETVCASDGKTYTNFCYYGQARCVTPTTHIVSVGWCGAATTTGAPAVTMPPATAVPTGGSMPTGATVDTTTATMTSTDAMTTMMTTQDALQQVFCASKDAVTCGTDLAPLCGSDGTFYLNKCEFSKANCDNPSLVIKGIDFCTGAGK